MSDSLWLIGQQHTSIPCHLVSSRVCSNSCPLSQWCHPPSHPLSLSPSPYHNSHLGTLVITGVHTIFRLSSFSSTILCSRTPVSTPHFPVTGSSHPSNYALRLSLFSRPSSFQKDHEGICRMSQLGSVCFCLDDPGAMDWGWVLENTEVKCPYHQIQGPCCQNDLYWWAGRVRYTSLSGHMASHHCFTLVPVDVAHQVHPKV